MIRLFQMFTWLCVAAIAVLSLVAPLWRPVTILPHDLKHVAIFAIAGFLAGLGYPGRPLRTLAAFVIFAGAIELADISVPGRHARLSDFVIDALAACVGVGAAFVIGGLGLTRRRPAWRRPGIALGPNERLRDAAALRRSVPQPVVDRRRGPRRCRTAGSGRAD